MNLDILGDIVLVVLLVGWLGYRQTTWRPVVPSRMWRTPLVLAVIGVVVLAHGGVAIGALDVAVLVIQLVLSLGVGAWMGSLAHFRPLDPPVVGRRGERAVFESRTGWWGLALWVVLLLVRIGLDVGATALGAKAIGGAGVILLVLAANRGARNAVLAARLGNLPVGGGRRGGALAR
ncbi:hypothetical protein [Microbacterium sp. SORGH_AS_0888]|uniref:hypothetical protein n=1 Tax=Microbacterium sp. SORGH_AS_0888 TaxID=3041791 RepID=UPI0027821A5A|nr:hypothetical protein [Microbacterium sp. SORGH_AS_0888]MDQ1128936.1 hypothetical protein [Microbacterium sp. SORGH_AS_0888]